MGGFNGFGGGSGGSDRPYKQLKLNKVTSPICTVSNQPKGVMVDYNSQYYLITSTDMLWKIRKSDDVIVGSINTSVYGRNTIPIVINDFAISFGNNGVTCVNLINLTYKWFGVPTTSSGGINYANTKYQHFDVRYVSGNQYQCLIWVDGSTAKGIIACTLDTTVASGQYMTQVSWYAVSPPPSQGACVFGLDGDTSYYVFDPNASSKFKKVPIATGVATVLIADIVDSLLLDAHSFRSSQTADYLIVQVGTSSGYALSDLVMINKSDGSYSYCGVQNSQGAITVPYVPCQTKNADYCVIANGQQIIVIKNDKTVTPILKSQDDLFATSAIVNTQTNGQRYEGILNYDIANNKILLAGACYFYYGNTILGTNTFAIREYDIA